MENKNWLLEEDEDIKHGNTYSSLTGLFKILQHWSLFFVAL
jgi:hypothetical protein